MEHFFYGMRPATLHKKAARFTIAVVNEDGLLKTNYALCSPRDQFQKNKGRLIAAGRARKRPLTNEPAKEGQALNQQIKEMGFTLKAKLMNAEDVKAVK